MDLKALGPLLALELQDVPDVLGPFVGAPGFGFCAGIPGSPWCLVVVVLGSGDL